MIEKRERPFEPYGAFNFFVDNISTGKFAEVTGLSFESEPIEYRVSDNPKIPMFRQGVCKLGRITLKKGLVNNTDLWDWIQQVEKGTAKRKSATIWVNDNTGLPSKGWNLMGCMPVKWSLSSLSGMQSQLVFETLELVVEKVEYTDPPK